MQKEVERVIKQRSEVEIFKRGDALSTARLLYDEALELVEATNEAFLNDDLTEVASEAADVLYLLINFMTLLGLKPKDVLEMKIQRNQEKYAGFDDAQTARETWEKQGGDEAYFKRYLEQK